MISHFIGEEEGQTLIEYGLLISFIALVVVSSVILFGQGVLGRYEAVAGEYPE